MERELKQNQDPIVETEYDAGLVYSGYDKSIDHIERYVNESVLDPKDAETALRVLPRIISYGVDDPQKAISLYQTLLDSGKVDINTPPRDDIPHFYNAALHGLDVSVLDYLVKKGADYNQGDYLGSTPLGMAEFRIRLAKHRIKRDEEKLGTTAGDETKRKKLTDAIEENRSDIVESEKLVEYLTKINAVSKFEEGSAA